MVRFVYILTVLVLCLPACSNNDDTSSSAKESKKTFIDPQLKALDKAKGVEQQLLDAAQQQRKLIDAQGNK